MTFGPTGTSVADNGTGLHYILAGERRRYSGRCQHGIRVYYSGCSAWRANLLKVSAYDSHWSDIYSLSLRVQLPKPTISSSLLILHSPVQTYGKKAAAKACINPQHHAIAFTGKVPPRPTPEEMEFKAHKTMLPSIRIDPDVRWDSLDPHSRVCYSEVYPVQLNVRVKAVGVVHPRYQQDFVKSYLAVLKDTIVPESVPAHAAALGQGFAPRLRQSSIVASTSDACYPPHSLHEGEDIDSSSSQAYSTSSMTSKLATMDVRLTQPVAAPARPTRHLFHPNTSK